MTDSVPGITVAGRVFRPVTSLTFPQYNWVTSALKCIDRKGVKDKEDLMARIAMSGRAEQILAGLVVEAGAKWSADLATEWKEVFESVADPDDCLLLRACLEAVVLGFFPGVVPSSESSEASSALSDTIPASTSEATRSEPKEQTNSESLALQPAE